MAPQQSAALRALRSELTALADPSRVAPLARFFKTGPGEYAAGDRFLGLTVPQVRGVVRRHRDLPLPDAEALLLRGAHEERLCALLILVEAYRRGDPARRQAVFDLYLRRTDRINNWDLVDSSAEHIVGPHVEDAAERRALLTRLAASPLLWERRIAMLATFHDIKRGRPDDALAVAELLLADRHDLIHKAVGWMLREIGQRCDAAQLRAFLDRHGAAMPRTALRYAIERLPEAERRRYLTRTRAGARPSGPAGAGRASSRGAARARGAGSPGT